VISAARHTLQEWHCMARQTCRSPLRCSVCKPNQKEVRTQEHSKRSMGKN
jgi:hypothetical protein